MQAKTTRISAVLDQISQAVILTDTAEQAYRNGDGEAGTLRQAAESAHFDLVKAICGLSEEEADSVESAFTGLEEQLLRLP